jgi:hypothetical protein
MRTSVFVCALAAVLLASEPVAAQRPPFRAGLAVLVHWVEVEYGDQVFDGQALILKGEPLEIDVGVVNSFRGPSAGAEVDWRSKIAITLSRGGRFDTGRPLVADLQCEDNSVILRSARTETQDGTLVLGDSGQQFYRCRFDTEALGIHPGSYTIEVRWLGSVLNASPFRHEYRSVEPAVIQFELRDILSASDLLDRDLHLAVPALNDNEPFEAERLANDVLARNAASSTAHIIRGRALVASGRCQQARANWHRAAAIVAGASDPLNRRQRRFSPHERETIAKGLQEEANRLPCR